MQSLKLSSLCWQFLSHIRGWQRDALVNPPCILLGCSLTSPLESSSENGLHTATWHFFLSHLWHGNSLTYWAELLQRETPAMSGQRGKHNSASSCALRAKCPRLSKKRVFETLLNYIKCLQRTTRASLGEQKQRNGAIHSPFISLFLLRNCSIKKIWKKKGKRDFSYHHLCLSCSFAFEITHAKENFKTFFSCVLSK